MARASRRRGYYASAEEAHAAEGDLRTFRISWPTGGGTYTVTGMSDARIVAGKDGVITQIDPDPATPEGDQ
jgi:hypothetical protein